MATHDTVAFVETSLIMSENAEKVISKPKVRFSQCSDNEKQKQGEKAVESCRQDRVAAPKRANGPKIRSIVTLKRPVRIVDPNKPIDTSDANVCPNNRETVASTRHDAAASKSTRETFSFKKNVSKVETSRILRNVNAKNTNPKVSRSDKIVHVRDGVSENRKTSQQKGKENKDVALKKTVPNKNISKTRMVRSHSAQLAMCKKMQHLASDIVAPVASTVDPKDSRMMKTQSVPNLGRKTTIQTSNVRVLGAKKSIVSGLIPCHKYIDVAKSKTPVKKIVLHNATSSGIKATVGPGIQRSKRRDDAKASDSNKKSAIASDKFTFGITAEKLAQPQYNSIKCTTNKLAELKRQKIVTDIDHLPPIQKNFVNEKVRYLTVQ